MSHCQLLLFMAVRRFIGQRCTKSELSDVRDQWIGILFLCFNFMQVMASRWSNKKTRGICQGWICTRKNILTAETRIMMNIVMCDLYVYKLALQADFLYDCVRVRDERIYEKPTGIILYLGKKEVYCMFKTLGTICLFSTKCRLFRSFIFW